MRPVCLKRVVSCISLVLAGWSVGSAHADATSALLAQGYQQWSAGHLDQAQHSYEQAVNSNPRSMDAHMKLAGLYIARKDYSASAKQYQRAIGLDPKNAKAWMGLGIAYLHSGDKSLTRAAWQEALRLEPARKPQLAPLLAKLDSDAAGH
jgi:tetratricopeptide (TPR) repeat protein